LKKPASSVRFQFYKQKTEKTEPNPNRKKTRKKTKPNRKNRAKPKNRAKTGKNRAKPVGTGFCLKNRTGSKPVGLTRFQFGLVTFFL